MVSTDEWTVRDGDPGGDHQITRPEQRGYGAGQNGDAGQQVKFTPDLRVSDTEDDTEILK